MALKDKAQGRKDVHNIDPRILEIAPGYNVRRINLEDPKFLELKESIRANGVRTPLTARSEKTPDGEKYFLVSGHRRLTATNELIKEGVEIRTVPVMAVKLSEEELTLDLIVSNDGQPLNQIEQGEVYQRLRNYGWFPEEIATKTGKSVTHVNNCLYLHNLPPDAKRPVFEGSMSASQLLNMSREHGDGEQLKAKVSEAVETAKAAGKKKVTAKTLKTPKALPILSQDIYTPLMNALAKIEFENDPNGDGDKIVTEIENYLNKKYDIQ